MAASPNPAKAYAQNQHGQLKRVPGQGSEGGGWMGYALLQTAPGRDGGGTVPMALRILFPVLAGFGPLFIVLGLKSPKDSAFGSGLAETGGGPDRRP